MELIEICGIGFPNRGAELLLRSIIFRLNESRPGAVPVCVPGPPATGSVPLMINSGGRLKAAAQVKGLDLARLGDLLPRRLLQPYHIVSERDCGALLDASGFAYSDQWGLKGTERGARLHRRYRKRKRPTVLLPQAYGPFRTQAAAAAAGQLFRTASLVFAREEHSRSAVLQVAPEIDVHVAPDITIGFAPYLAAPYRARQGFGIIPNIRMLDKAGVRRERYVGFLAAAAARAATLGEEVLWINHEGAPDRDLIDQARLTAGGVGTVFDPGDALAIKKRIGECRAVLSSRYHGLVSALSQGVPAIATSWSHKYSALLGDFDCEDHLVSDFGNPANGAAAVELVLAAADDDAKHSALLARSEELARLVDSVWLEVFQVLDTREV